MDGLVEVTLPDTSVVVLPLERLTRLYDGLEQIEDVWGEELSEDQANEGGTEDMVWDPDDPTGWRAKDPSDSDEWEDEELMASFTVMDEEPSVWSNNVADTSSLPPVSHDEMDYGSTTATPQMSILPLHDSSSLSDGIQSESRDVEVDSSHWKRFEILSSAPSDHSFFDTIPTHPSRKFLGRLSKEYKALSSSLPGGLFSIWLMITVSISRAESIMVRGYEDRTDLLRSLIIGPENTPYEDAPFVIDWKLESDFPVSPPIAHFMSWTNGNGRGEHPASFGTNRVFIFSLL
jgi:ubiquitin-conjugating enzyme E2 O